MQFRSKGIMRKNCRCKPGKHLLPVYPGNKSIVKICLYQDINKGIRMLSHESGTQIKH